MKINGSLVIAVAISLVWLLSVFIVFNDEEPHHSTSTTINSEPSYSISYGVLKDGTTIEFHNICVDGVTYLMAKRGYAGYMSVKLDQNGNVIPCK